MKLAGLGLLAILAVGATFGFDLIRGGEAKDTIDEAALFAVRRGTLEITITENGYLKAENSEQLKPKFRGSGTLTWLIDEGSDVVEGDLLAEFDKTEIETDLTDTRNKVTEIQTELEAAQAELKIQGRDNEAEIEKAQVGEKVAELTHERYVKGEYPNEQRKKKLAVEKAESELSRAQERFKQVPDLVEEGFMTKIQEEEERIKVEEAKIALESAHEDRKLYETYTYPMELAQKESAVRDADRTLTNSREKAGIRLKEREAQVSNHKRRLDTTEARVKKLEEELEAMTMNAPSAGVVLYGNASRPWERDRIKVGNQVYQGLTVITLPDLSVMQVQLKIHEADINQIELDQDAVITLETYRGQVFTGKVVEVATVADSSDWGDSTNKQFRVLVTMDASETELRAGITAKVEIKVGAVEDVLYVPVHAVVAEGGEHFCWIVAEGEVVRRIVTIGKNDAHYVEVVTGLEEGEQVLLYDPRTSGGSDDGEKDKTNGADEADEAETPGVPAALTG